MRSASDHYNTSIECAHSDCLKIKFFVVETGDVEWSYDSHEEFFSNYRTLDFSLDHRVRYETKTICYKQGLSLNFSVWGQPRGTTVLVEAGTRPEIEAVHSVFENASSEGYFSLETEEPEVRPIVFIGHGRSQIWRELKDHLQDLHGYKIEAYEVGARAGHAIRDILDSMLDSSSLALLVMTAEDEMADGTFQPRMNVVHELGLFQGRLGWTRGIMLLEEGSQEFSNMSGVQQIRFSKENIKEVFGDVLATLSREFSPSPH